MSGAPWLHEARDAASARIFELDLDGRRFHLPLGGDDLTLALLNNALFTWLPATLAWRVDGDDAGLVRAFERLTAPVSWGTPSVVGGWCARANGRSLRRRAWSEAPPPAVAQAVPPSLQRRVLGIDVGGSDLKLVVVQDREELARSALVWPRPLAELLRDDALLDVLSDAIAPLTAALDGPVDAIGLSWPDHVVAGRIVGGLTSKTRSLTSAWGDAAYWAAFEQRVAALPARLAARLDAPVHTLSDGAAAAWRLAQHTTGPALALALGTSLTAAWVDADGAPSDRPAYASGLAIALDGPAHSATGLRGCAQASATQTALLAALGIADRHPAQALQDVLLAHTVARRDALAHAGRGLGALVRELCAWLPEPPVEVHLYGRLVAGGAGSELLLQVARDVSSLDLQQGSSDEAVFGQARGAARYGGAR